MEGAEDRPAVLSARMTKNTAAYLKALPYEPETEPAAVPAWLADRRAIESSHTELAWREHLTERYEYLAKRLHERGDALVADPPAWAAQLGAVPEEPVRRQAWADLAAEVATFRDRYQVPEADEDAVPAAYRERSVGADLQERVVATHNSAALREDAIDRKRRVAALHEPDADGARRRREAWEAAHGRKMTIRPSSSNQFRGAEAAQAPAQERDEGLKR